MGVFPLGKGNVAACRASGAARSRVRGDDYRLSLREGVGLKAMVLLALIFMVAPVCGLRPFRAARSRNVKVPKPGYAKRFSLQTAWPMALKVASSSVSVSFLLRLTPEELVTWSMKVFLGHVVSFVS